MDNSILLLITIGLFCIVGYSLFFNKNIQNKSKCTEGYESYPPEALSLAQKNERNIAELNANMKVILEMAETVNSLKEQTDANTDSISTLVEQCK